MKEAGSKELRGNPFGSAAEQGRVKLVEGNWINDFLDEFEIFSEGAYDDIVDATSGAFSKFREYGPVGGDTAQVFLDNRKNLGYPICHVKIMLRFTKSPQGF